MKKFKFIKLLGFAPLVTVPLIAAGCGGGNTGLTAGQKAVGNYVLHGIIPRLKKLTNYSVAGKAPSVVSVYKAGTKAAFTVDDAYNFINSNGSPKTTEGVTTYKFAGNTALTTKSVVPFATIDVGNGTDSITFNLSISFDIKLKTSDNSIDKTSTVVIDSNSTGAEFFSATFEGLSTTGKATDINPADKADLTSFFKSNNIVNVYDWMYTAAPIPAAAALAGGATDTKGLVTFPVKTDTPTPPTTSFNIPKGSKLKLPTGSKATTALVGDYVALGSITIGIGITGEVITIATASAPGLYYFSP